MTATAEDISTIPQHMLSPAGLAREVDPTWKYPWHLQYAIRRIMNCIATPNGRLMIFMPPRSGKSETVSKFTPAQYLGMNPDQRVILTSYEADFAASWGKKTRDILEEHGPEKYGVRVDPSSSASNRWNLERFDDATKEWKPEIGGMVTAGVGGPITGKGFNLGIIDDPFKNAQDALSLKIRENVKEWYRSTFYTRREPGASIIIIMTRWHEDDLAGWLLEQAKEDPDADEWEVVSMPAIATGQWRNPKGEIVEPDDPDAKLGDEVWTDGDVQWLRKRGMALWPERFDEAALKKTRAAVGAFWWASLYQQDPQPAAELGKFKRHWFKYREKKDWPQLHGRVRYWDLAATSDKDPTADPDWTVGALMGRNQDGTFLEDIVRFREDPGAVDDRIVATAREDGYDVQIRIEQEPGSSGKIAIRHFKRLKGLQGYDVRGYKTTGNKELRANPLASEAQGTDGTDGELYLLKAEWNKEFVDEAIQFPYGEHDDQVDAASGSFAVLARRPGATVGGAEVSRTSPWRQA